MQIRVMYRPEFIRAYGKLERALQEEVKEKILEFEDSKNHTKLRVHKLHGHLKGRLGFSVNYGYRIIFEYVKKGAVSLITIGDHEIYR